MANNLRCFLNEKVQWEMTSRITARVPIGPTGLIPFNILIRATKFSRKQQNFQSEFPI